MNIQIKKDKIEVSFNFIETILLFRKKFILERKNIDEISFRNYYKKIKFRLLGVHIPKVYCLGWFLIYLNKKFVKCFIYYNKKLSKNIVFLHLKNKRYYVLITLKSKKQIKRIEEWKKIKNRKTEEIKNKRSKGEA